MNRVRNLKTHKDQEKKKEKNGKVRILVFRADVRIQSVSITKEKAGAELTSLGSPDQP